MTAAQAGPTGSAGRDPVVPGHVSVRRRALQRLTVAIVAEAWHVDRHAVRVDASDDGGSLRLRVATPVRVDAVAVAGAAGAATGEGGLVARVRELQGTVAHRVRQLGGHAVSSVDVTVTGLADEHRGRVA